MGYNHKNHFCNGRRITRGRDLTAEEMEAFKNGEVCLSVKPDGKAVSVLLMDSYDKLRELKLSKCDYSLKMEGLPYSEKEFNTLSSEHKEVE